VSKRRRSGCPIASTLEVIGDRWTLVLLRDLVTGKQAFKEFAASPERIPTNILADRLRQLQAWGLVERRVSEGRAGRYVYVLTKKGAELLPVLQELCRWGNRYLEDTWRPPAYFMRERPSDALRRLARKRRPSAQPNA
jgi:DNA-binding HxlR family transcriptional regulator